MIYVIVVAISVNSNLVKKRCNFKHFWASYMCLCKATNKNKKVQ
jgi:hypothetical protein